MTKPVDTIQAALTKAGFRVSRGMCNRFSWLLNARRNGQTTQVEVFHTGDLLRVAGDIIEEGQCFIARAELATA